MSRSTLRIKLHKVASPAREPCTPGHREVHRVWMASDSKIKTEDKRKDRRIVREILMQWNQAGYKAHLQKDLKDIRQKFSRVLGQDLDKSDNPFVEATGPVERIEGSVLVDLCMQKSGGRESGCDAPKASEGFPKASEGFPKASEVFPMHVASPPRTPTPPAAQVKQYSWGNYAKKEVCLYIRTLKPLKTKKEERKLKFKRPGASNCQNHSDVILSDVIDSDFIVNKPVARKHYVQKKHSLVHTKGFLKSMLSVCSQTFTKVALMLAIVISILGGVFNVKLPEQISTIGTSSRSLRSSELAKPRTTIRCHGYSTLSEPTLTRNVLEGKHWDTYIFPSADFWASRVYCLDTYTANLKSDNNFTVFYDLIYRYIYTFYRSWSSCNWAIYPRAILYTLAYFSLNSIVSVIGIHDKYQSLILIGLALTEKASFRIQYILFHFRSYWRGWRPLVTPLAGCIKEGIEPRIFQKRFMLSHAQVRFSLCSLLLLLFCFCFHCSYCYYYYYYYYGYLLAKGFYYSSGYEYKPGHFNKQKLLSCSMLCFSLLLFALPFLSLSSDDIICVEGYPTHMISPALLPAFARCFPFLSLSSDDIICVEGYPTHIVSPALLLAFALCFPFLSLSSDDIIGVEGYPTHIVSPALLLAFAHCFPFLSLSSDDIIGVEGYPTHIISPALLLAFALCFPFLSLSPLMTL